MTLLALRCCIFAVAMIAAPTTAEPRFSDFTVPVVRTRHKATVQISGLRSHQYAAMLRDAVTKPENFAGHYILDTFGCGASCVVSAAIDKRTGVVTWLPFTVCCWSLDRQEPLDFKLTSKLLVVHGRRDEKGGIGPHYFSFNGRRFSLVRGHGPMQSVETAY